MTKVHYLLSPHKGFLPTRSIFQVASTIPKHKMERRRKYSRYDSTITVVTIIGVLIPLLFTIIFVYLVYIRAQKRAIRAQQNATKAAKAICATIMQSGITGSTIQSALGNNETGKKIEGACRDLLGQ